MRAVISCANGGYNILGMPSYGQASGEPLCDAPACPIERVLSEMPFCGYW